VGGTRRAPQIAVIYVSGSHERYCHKIDSLKNLQSPAYAARVVRGRRTYARG